MNGKPGGTIGAGVAWPIVLREHAANDILVNCDAEDMRDLLGDAHVAETRIAPLHLDDGCNEFRGRTFGTGLSAMRRGRKEQAILAIHQGLVELEQRGRLDECAQLRNPARIHKQRSQTEHDAIERRQIRCSSSGSIADQKLMFEQKRLRGDGPHATWAEQLCEGDQQVDGEDEEFAHGANAIMITSVRKTAPHRRIPSYC